jgi:hypothetical protein
MKTNISQFTADTMSASLARAKAPEFTTDAVMPSGDFGKVSLKELTAGGKCVCHTSRALVIASSRPPLTAPLLSSLLPPSRAGTSSSCSTRRTLRLMSAPRAGAGSPAHTPARAMFPARNSARAALPPAPSARHRLRAPATQGPLVVVDCIICAPGRPEGPEGAPAAARGAWSGPKIRTRGHSAPDTWAVAAPPLAALPGAAGTAEVIPGNHP